MKIEVSNGEIVDKYTILIIKRFKIDNKDKLINIEKEIAELMHIVYSMGHDMTDFFTLTNVNFDLWHVEDDLRQHEKNQVFDDKFIELARKVYELNDLRASIKRKINIDTNSNLIEEKSY